MTILVFPQNRPFWYEKPTAESAFRPHFQIVKVREDAINSDAEDRELEECGMEESLHVIPISVKEGEA